MGDIIDFRKDHEVYVLVRVAHGETHDLYLFDVLWGIAIGEVVFRWNNTRQRKALSDIAWDAEHIWQPNEAYLSLLLRADAVDHDLVSDIHGDEPVTSIDVGLVHLHVLMLM